nr:hypothetical protein [Marinicella sp. W31]MDC2877858.1 hypothetical protein [Marinicella sp. W31]
MREPEKDPDKCRERRQAEVRINKQIIDAADTYREAARRNEKARSDRASAQNEVYRLQAAQAAATAAGMAPHPAIRGGASVVGIGLDVALARAEEKLRQLDGASMRSRNDMESAKEKRRFWSNKLAENAAEMRDLNCVFSY